MAKEFVGFPVEYKKRNRQTGDESGGIFYVRTKDNTPPKLTKGAIVHIIKEFIPDDDFVNCDIYIRRCHKVTVSNGTVYYVLRFPDSCESLPIDALNVKRRG